MKLDIQSLAILLSDYATYLREQNKKAKYLQSFAHPVLSIADNLDFRFLPRCETTPSLLTGLESRLAEKNEFEYVVVEDVCPSDPRRKYEYLQMLKSSGLALNAAMLTYTHGNNMGNTHFAWKKFQNKVLTPSLKASVQLKRSGNKFLHFTQEQCDVHCCRSMEELLQTSSQLLCVASIGS